MCGCGKSGSHTTQTNFTGTTVYSTPHSHSSQTCCPALPCVEQVRLENKCKCPSYKDKWRYQDCCPSKCRTSC